MADTGQEKTDAGSNKIIEKSVSPLKRKLEDSTEEECLKKAVKPNPVIKPTGPIRMTLSGKSDKAKDNNAKQATAAAAVVPIKMSLSTSSKVKEQGPVKPKTKQIASVFNESDSEEEEMPAEAKMRMRNVGRETPTAAGPNSFGKGNLGFCDRTKMIERELKRQMDEYTGKEDSKG